MLCQVYRVGLIEFVTIDVRNDIKDRDWEREIETKKKVVVNDESKDEINMKKCAKDWAKKEKKEEVEKVPVVLLHILNFATCS